MVCLSDTVRLYFPPLSKGIRKCQSTKHGFYCENKYFPILKTFKNNVNILTNAFLTALKWIWVILHQIFIYTWLSKEEDKPEMLFLEQTLPPAIHKRFAVQQNRQCAVCNDLFAVIKEEMWFCDGEILEVNLQQFSILPVNDNQKEISGKVENVAEKPSLA